ncbi:degenerin unc-8 [Aphelenchoides avenae]|nr:degenerin unc-8 [Aphelenchus avenae]
MDAEYGNCYTFNFNDSVLLKNDRVGPAHGLRLLLNVDQSDYVSTTESAGVRVVVHEQDQEPFPDTFGYNAPTGFVSSFGLRMKALYRLESPNGKCRDNLHPAGYIYDEHYSVENFDFNGGCPGNPALVNDSRACREHYRANTAQVEVYYERLGYESAVESPEYTLVSLLSHIGLGLVLWIGFSFITCLEVIEFFCEILLHSVMRKPRKGRQGTAHPDDEQTSLTH